MKQLSWVFVVSIFGLLSSCLSNSVSESQQAIQFSKDTASIASYLKLNNIHATKLAQGVWFIIDSGAEGIRPTFYDSVKLKYTMKLMTNNAVVDQSAVSKHFVLDSLVGGIQIAMPQFQTGSKGRIFIPSLYGYVANTGGTIPANSNLIFEFQLTDVKDYQLKLDTAKIGTYLRAHTINAFKDISGLRYTIQSLGTGVLPALTDEVQVTYTAKTMSDDIVVDQGNAAVFLLSNLILGWQIGLPKFPEGTTFTLFIPSKLAFGPSGSGNTIKGNENMIFNIQLLKVNHP